MLQTFETVYVLTAYDIRMLATKLKVNVLWNSSADFFVCECNVATNVGCESRESYINVYALN